MTIAFMPAGKVSGNVSLQKFAHNTALARLGWNRQNLSDLTRRLEAVLVNFEKFAQSGLKFKATITHRACQEGKTDITMTPESREILIFLEDSPRKSLEEVLFGMSQLFMQLSYSSRELLLYHQKALIPLLQDKEAFINDRITSIVSDTGSLGLNPPEVERLLVDSIKDGCDKITAHKFALSLFHPYAIPRVPLEKAIKGTFSALYKQVEKTKGKTVSHPWEYISDLAVLSVFGKKATIEGFTEDCKDAVSGELGERLARLEFLKMDRSQAPSSYPSLATTQPFQIEQIKEGFMLFFDFFQGLYDSFYDKLEFSQNR